MQLVCTTSEEVNVTLELVLPCTSAPRTAMSTRYKLLTEKTQNEEPTEPNSRKDQGGGKLGGASGWWMKLCQ